ncbi:hypothetical protein PILCRDRAFT_9762 [Piloderma croceum F 1598]|uniref:Uncharacterized protein n=1 Tax=Piloderma croceum (strain F 1598) TaxID=765440 RepID=A0A0C3FL13_PILCF|nr:hypothetical protein PILCRDRAFT_9762 [Piloderma croceum F 1598]
MNYEEEKNEAASVSAKPKARPTGPPKSKIYFTTTMTTSTTATTPKKPQEPGQQHPRPTMVKKSALAKSSRVFLGYRISRLDFDLGGLFAELLDLFVICSPDILLKEYKRKYGQEKTALSSVKARSQLYFHAPKLDGQLPVSAHGGLLPM